MKLGIKNKNIGGASVDAILLTFIKLVTTVLGLATTRLLSEYLSIHDYGTYSQILMVTSTVATLTIFGMMDGMNYFFCRETDNNKREAYTATIFSLQLIFGTIAGTIVMLLSAPLCAFFENPDVKNLLIFAAILPVMQNLLWILQVLIVSVGKARMLAIRNLVVSLVRLAAVLVIVFFVRNVVVIMAATLLLDVGQILFFYGILHKKKCYIKLSKVDFRLVGEILKYCAPMAIFIIVNYVNRDLDKYFISIMTDTETLALFANASKQLPFDIIMASFCTVLIPYITRYISENNKEKAADLYRLFLEITYISTGILCCAALSSAPQLMKLLYTNKYTSGIAIFCIYILVDLFRFTNITLVLSAAGRTKRLMLIGIGVLAANSGLNVILYKAVGIIGPAIATLAVTVITGMLMLHFSARVLDTKLSRFFDLKYLMLFVSESIVLMLVLNGLQKLLEKWDVHYFFVLTIVAGIYVVIMLLVNGKRLIGDMKRVNNISKE